MAITVAQLVVDVVADTASAGASVDTLAGLLSKLGGVSASSAVEFGVAGVAVAGLAAVLDASLSAAANFQTMLQQLQANSQLTAQDMPQVATSIKSMADQSGASLQGLADGYRHASSEGFNFADSQQIVSAAMKLAVGTGADLNQTADLVATTLKTFGLAASDAGAATNVLLTAAQAGNITMSDLANSGKQVLGMAGALGVSLPDVTAAFAALTREGNNSQRTATGLMAIMQQIINPTKSATAAIAAMSQASGVDLTSDFTLSGLSAKGLTGIMNDLQTAVGANTQEVLKAVTGWRGGRQAIELVTQGNADLNGTLAQTTAAFSGQTDVVGTAYQAALGTAGRQLDIFGANLKTAGITLGTDFLPVATDALRLLNQMASFAGKVYTTTQKIVVDFSQTNLGGGIGDAFSAFGSGLQVEGRLLNAAVKLPGQWSQALAQTLGTPPDASDQRTVQQKLADYTFGLLAPAGGAPSQYPAGIPAAQFQSIIAPYLDSFRAATVNAAATYAPEQGAANPITAMLARQAAAAEPPSDEAMAAIVQKLQVQLQQDMGKMLTLPGPGEVPQSAQAFVDQVNASLDRAAQSLAQSSEGAQLAGAVKQSTAAAGASAQAGADDAAKQIASATDTIAKSLEDGMKALVDVANFQVPDISATVDKLTGSLDQLYSSFATAFSGVDAGQATDLGKVAQSTSDQIKAMSDLVSLLQTLPDVNVGDPSAKVDQLVAVIGRIRDAWQPIFQRIDDLTTQNLQGDAAKAISSEVTALSDVAKLLGDIQGIPVGDPGPTLDRLAAAASQVKDKSAAFLASINAVQATQLGAAADAVGKEATMLKDTADVFKEMAGVDISDPSGKLGLLAQYAQQIKDQTTSFLDLTKANADNVGASADAVGKEATMLKDTADLFKEMAGVDISDPSGKVGLLSSYASQITDLTTGFLTFSKDSADQIGASADAVGREATMLKDVTDLFKEMADVEISDPSGKIAALASEAQSIQADTTNFLNWSKTDADNISASADAVGKEATMLKDVTDLFKEMEAVTIADPSGKIGLLAQEALQIQTETTSFLDWTKTAADTIGASADAVSKEATLLKDVTDLFSSMAAVTIADPSGKIGLLADAAQRIQGLVTPLLGWTQAAATNLSASAAAISAEVTLLKSTADLYTTMAAVEIADPTDKVAQLAGTAERIDSLLSGYLQQLAAGGHGPEQQAAATALGAEITALSDTANLLKTLADVDLGAVDPASLQRLPALLQQLADAWDQAATLVNGDLLLRAQQVNAGVTADLDVLTAGLSALAGLQTLVPPAQSQIVAFTGALWALLSQWDETVALWPDNLLSRAQDWSLRITPALAPLASGLSVLKDLQALVAPSQSQLVRFATDLAGLLSTWDSTIATWPENFLARTSTWQARLGAALTPVTSGVAVLADLDKETPPGAVAIANFARDLHDLLSVWDGQVATFPPQMLAAATRWSAQVETALGPVKTGVDALNALGTLRPPDVEQIQRFATDTATVVNALNGLFTNQIGAGLRINTDALQNASSQWPMVTAALSSVSAGMTAITALGTYGGVSDAQITAAVSAIAKTVNAYTQAIGQVNTILAGDGAGGEAGLHVNAQLLADAQESAGQITTLMGSVEAGVKAMTALASFAPPSSQQIHALIASMTTAVQEYLSGLGQITISIDQQQATGGVQAIIDTIAKGVGLFSFLPTLGPDTDRQITALVGQIAAAVSSYETQMAKIAVTLDQKNQTEGVGAIIAVIAQGIGAFAALQAVAGVPGTALSGAADAVVEAAQEFIDRVNAIPLDQIAAAASRANMITAILSTLSLGQGGQGVPAGAGVATQFSSLGPVPSFAMGAGSGEITEPGLALLGEDAPRYPEFVIPTNPAYHSRALGLLAGAASRLGMAVPAFAAGGGGVPLTGGPPVKGTVEPLDLQLAAIAAADAYSGPSLAEQIAALTLADTPSIEPLSLQLAKIAQDDAASPQKIGLDSAIASSAYNAAVAQQQAKLAQDIAKARADTDRAIQTAQHKTWVDDAVAMNRYAADIAARDAKYLSDIAAYDQSGEQAEAAWLAIRTSALGAPTQGKFAATGNTITEPQLAVVGEDAPRYPEYIIPTNPAYHARAVGLLAGAAASLGVGLRGFAAGGGGVPLAGGPPVKGTVEPLDLQLAAIAQADAYSGPSLDEILAGIVTADTTSIEPLALQIAKITQDDAGSPQKIGLDVAIATSAYNAAVAARDAKLKNDEAAARQNFQTAVTSAARKQQLDAQVATQKYADDVAANEAKFRADIAAYDQAQADASAAHVAAMEASLGTPTQGKIEQPSGGGTTGGAQAPGSAPRPTVLGGVESAGAAAAPFGPAAGFGVGGGAPVVVNNTVNLGNAQLAQATTAHAYEEISAIQTRV